MSRATKTERFDLELQAEENLEINYQGPYGSCIQIEADLALRLCADSEELSRVDMSDDDARKLMQQAFDREDKVVDQRDTSDRLLADIRQRLCDDLRHNRITKATVNFILSKGADDKPASLPPLKVWFTYDAGNRLRNAYYDKNDATLEAELTGCGYGLLKIREPGE